MAYLHLPEHHTAGDLALAGQVAEAFESEDLFVTWTHSHGPGARPAIDAVLRETPPHPLAQALCAVAGTIARAWRALIGASEAPQPERPPRERQAA